MITRNEKQQCSEKYLLQWHMSTTDPTWIAMGIDLDLRGQEPTTIRLKNGMDLTTNKYIRTRL
jgi:hypothetical protein